MASLSGVSNLQVFTNAGDLAAGYRLYTYEYGTTTHKTVYTDAAGAVAHTYTSDGTGGQYIAIDARGELPAPLYYATGSYDLCLKTAAGATVWTRRADPVADSAAAYDVALRADIASTASTSLGDALMGVQLNVTGGGARTQHAHNADFRRVTDFYANGVSGALVDPTGVVDSTLGIQAAINSYASGNGTVYFPPGTYKVTGTITVAQDRIHLVGAGPHSTQINFAPTANGTCIKLAKAVTGLINKCSIRGFSFYSTDSTYVKTAIEVVVGAEPLIEDVAIAGSVVHFPNSSFWSDATRASVGLQIRGHEAGTVNRFKCYADYPIKVSKNPNDGGVPAEVIDLDHWTFFDLYLGATRNCIHFDTGLNVTNVRFSGRQAWVLGVHGFYWADTTASISSNGLHFDDVRMEQGLVEATLAGTGVAGTNWNFYIAHNQGLYNLTFNAVRCDGVTRKGFYLRKCIGVDFLSTHYEGTSFVALDADATVDKISGRNCFWQSGSTKTFAGQRPMWIGPMDPSNAALSPHFSYIQDSTTARTLRTGLAIFGSNDPDNAAPVSMADSTTQIVASDNATGRLFISTQENTSAEFVLQGTAHTTVERDDPSGHFSNTLDTPTSWNVYHDGSNYVIQNKRGSTFRVGWLLIGSDTAI